MDKIGETGRYPRGKYNDDDEGEIRFALGADPKTGTVVIDFGKPVVWVGMPSKDARHLAEMLVYKADVADGTIDERGETGHG